ncbi:MAG: DUF4363 family protein [Clostridia bacterium]|jgi:hypothetical protein|nr:DUF4363 family protein [Clostridia bacterium]MDD3232378.1 DUF4363 family protein [Clostridia bacterium]MDD3862880.1 DUF4363 family protein [Clostridia bacterium]MDD4408698.1 DUF4363 family protein [Clostridia bacterium]
MNNRLVYILIIIVLLAGVCVWEQVMVEAYLSTMEEKVYNIIDVVEGKEDINTTEIYELVEDMEKEWDSYELNFCFLVNYKDIEEIGVEITKMKIYIVENDTTDFKASLAQILYFTDSYRQVMGIALDNIL